MSRLLPLIPVVAAGLVFASPAPATRAAEPEPKGEAQRLVDRWVASRALKGTTVGVSVVGLDGADIRASHGAEALMNPASGTKLLTTAAALWRWRPERTQVTRVLGRMDAEGRVAGDLRLVGGGDPKLLPEHLAALAKRLREAGLNRVDGDLVVDASAFDAHLVPPAFDQKNTTAGYRASIGAAASNYGAVWLTVKPAKKPGGDARAWIRPRTHGVRLVNRATTVAGDAQDLRVFVAAGRGGRTRLSVEGTIGVKARRHHERHRVLDPDALTGWLLRDDLRAAGIDIAGTVRVERKPAGAPLPELARHESQPLIASLTDLNVWSNNFMAETVFKLLGEPEGGGACTQELARRRVEQTLLALGLAPGSFRVVNGSGLYDATHVAPAAMTRLLEAMHRDPRRGPLFEQALAVSGKPGTLRRRLRRALKGRVKGKTGTLDDVVSLSGYLTTKKGTRLAFSVMINDADATRTGRLRRHIDRLVRALDGL